MGMIANYQPTTDIELEKITCLDDVEELQESEDIEICDIDKMWDALHFLLTGKSASEPIEDDLISEAIVGQFNISEEDFISGTKADRVKEIARALQEIDFETYLDKFDMSAFSQNDIYPNIWGYEDEADEIKDDLRNSFENLKKFYEKMAALRNVSKSSLLITQDGNLTCDVLTNNRLKSINSTAVILVKSIERGGNLKNHWKIKKENITYPKLPIDV